MKIETFDLSEYLKPITPADFGIISDFLKNYPSEICDFNICYLFSWGLYYKLEYTIYRDRLFLFNPFHSYLLAPIGEKFSANELFQITGNFKKINNVGIAGISENYIADENAGEYFSIESDEAWDNYIYMTENLVNLPGKKLAKKKNLISQFKRLYADFSLKPIDANDYDEIMKFCYYWRETHDIGAEYLDVEFEAIKTILTCWDLFPCGGLKLYANGKICAFSIYSPQTANMATVHFEKYDPTIKGAGQVINQETAKLLIKKYEYINREEDMGFAGIRQAKRSYQPTRMLPYYKLKGRR
ncbi:MAG: phosphatidylglycerol lysyltransferase domain-containing protein [Treponema sp.]|nr:phosphatidylglycerol lysyltransferase domain-containing protein [Treponema sp.]